MPSWFPRKAKCQRCKSSFKLEAYSYVCVVVYLKLKLCPSCTKTLHEKIDSFLFI